MDRVCSRFFNDIFLVEQPPQFVLQGLRRHHIDPVGVGPGCHAPRCRDFLAILGRDDFLSHHLELAEPIPLERVPQCIQCGGGRFFQVKFACQQFHIRGGNIAFRDLQVEIRCLASDGRTAS